MSKQPLQLGTRQARRWLAAAALTSSCALGCLREARMDAQSAQIAGVILDAEASGALRCAPRELAVARSQLAFAELERAQGFSSKAEEHLRIADRHAQAARLLSPVEHCRPRAPERADGPASGACGPAGSACGSP